MKLHHIRNATFVIEQGDHYILVDPMIGPKGTIPPFSIVRFKPKRNPIVNFPKESNDVLKKTTECIITHKHPDHIDRAAIKFLKRQKTPVACSAKDARHFERKGLNVTQSVEYWTDVEFRDGTITGVPARHGYGFIAGRAGNVMGFNLALKNAPSIYISADTILTHDVETALKRFKPDITVVACGTAQLDIGQPLLMTLDDVVKFIRLSPGKVLCNHMEALNHCPTTRQQLKERLGKENLLDKVWIPEDGEAIEV